MNIEDAIELCKRGDRKAQNYMFELFYPLICSISRRYVDSQDDAESIAINSFYKAFLKIKDYRGEGSFEGWLKRIVINEALGHIRKEKRVDRPTEELESIEEVDESDDIWIDITQEQLFELILKLPPKARVVFNLYVLDGYSHRDIAKELNITESTSKSHLKWARIKLRSFVSQLIGSYE